MPTAAPDSSRRLGVRIAAVCAIAAVQAVAFVSTFAAAFALGDAGRPAPALLKVAVRVLGFPALLFVGPTAQALLGDPAEIYVAAGLGGLVWGAVGVALFTVSRRWRQAPRAESAV